jgi:hypothetical protein
MFTSSPVAAVVEARLLRASSMLRLYLLYPGIEDRHPTVRPGILDQDYKRVFRRSAHGRETRSGSPAAATPTRSINGPFERTL